MSGWLAPVVAEHTFLVTCEMLIRLLSTGLSFLTVMTKLSNPTLLFIYSPNGNSREFSCYIFRAEPSLLVQLSKLFSTLFRVNISYCGCNTTGPAKPSFSRYCHINGISSACHSEIIIGEHFTYIKDMIESTGQFPR